MDEDEMQDAIRPGDPLQRQLARYARVRLEPDPAATRRTRAAVMEAAWRQRLDTPAVAAAPVSRSSSRMPFARWSPGRLGGTFAAAVLAGLLVAGTVFAGSRAGGALYPARLALEVALLPADPEARVQAELALAQTRLAEASQAAVAGDEGALEAALAAYADVVDDLATAVDGRADQALAAVELHLDVLRELQGRVPAAAAPAIERALERSSGAIDRLEDAGGREPGPQPGSVGADPTATPEPAATERPERSPKPTATPTDAPSDVPTPAPAGAPTGTPDAGKTEKPAKTAAPATGDDAQGG